MSITSCPKCARQISTDVDRCPHCGAATPRKWHGVKPAVRFVAAFLGVLSLTLYYAFDDAPAVAGLSLRWICVGVGVCLILVALLLRSRVKPRPAPPEMPDFSRPK